PNADVASVHRQMEAILAFPAEEAIDASAKMGIGSEEILEAFVKRDPASRPPVDQTLRSLFIDSAFNSYRCAVGYVRVVSGTIEDGNSKAGSERFRVHLSTGEFRCARIWISLRISGIATHGDHPGTTPARV